MAVHWKDKRDVYALFCLISQSLSLSKQKPDNEVVSQNKFRLDLYHSLVQPLLALRETPGVRAVRGPCQPPVPNALLVDMHMHLYNKSW